MSAAERSTEIDAVAEAAWIDAELLELRSFVMVETGHLPTVGAVNQLRARVAQCIAQARAEALREAGIKVGKMRHGVTGRRVANAAYLGEVVYAMGDEVLYQAERRKSSSPSGE